MELSDVLTLHSSIKNMGENNIITIFQHFTGIQLKQLLSIYLQYFFIKNKRNHYLNNNNNNDSLNNNDGHSHLGILKQLKTNIVKLKILNKTQKNLTIFHHKTNSNGSNLSISLSQNDIDEIVEDTIDDRKEMVTERENSQSHSHSHSHSVSIISKSNLSSSHSSNHKKSRTQIIGNDDVINEVTPNSCMANLFDIDGYTQNHCIIDNILPQVLLSYIMSFMDHKTRLIASKVNHLFFVASSQSISKYHLLINSSVVSNKLIYSPNNINLFKYYKSISWWSSYKFHTETNMKWQNFKQNMTKLLQSQTLENLDIVTLPVYRDRCEELEELAFKNANIKQLKLLRKSTNVEFLHSLEKLEITRTDMEPLWINQNNENAENERGIDNGIYDTAILIHNYRERPRRISNKGRNMSKYFINKSNIKHLILKEHWFKETEGTEFKSFFHPIYWLWNLPSLEECELTFVLNPTSQFQQHYSKMLSSAAVKQVAQNQVSFKKLVIELKYVNQEDIAVFCEYLRVLYPNLQQLSILLSTVPRPKPLQNLEWQICFRNLHEIRLNLPTTKDGQIFLQEIINSKDKNDTKLYFDNLRVLHLEQMKPPTAMFNDRYTFITQEMNDLLLIICQFIKKRPKNLHSFGIDIMRWAQHQKLSTTYWKPIMILLDSLLKSIKEENDIFDGYLSLGIPFCGFLNQRNIRTDADRHWWTGEYSWDDENNQGSLDIAHAICELQTEIANRNKIHETDKKLILDLNKLVLRKKHDKFLRFWFNDDDELYDGSKFIMQ